MFLVGFRIFFNFILIKFELVLVKLFRVFKAVIDRNASVRLLIINQSKLDNLNCVLVTPFIWLKRVVEFIDTFFGLAPFVWEVTPISVSSNAL